MWILLNNKPVCVFDIQTVSEILPLKNDTFLLSKYRGTVDDPLPKLYPEEHREYRKDMDEFDKKIQEAGNNASINKLRFNTDRLYGYYFTVTFKDGTTMYSTLYADEGTTTYARDCLLRKINRIVADLERITI